MRRLRYAHLAAWALLALLLPAILTIAVLARPGPADAPLRIAPP
jgi:hypothetical protein